MLSRFKWYRKFKGGIWYYNRAWFDLGRGCIWWWSRRNFGYIGGPLCTLRKEEY